LIKTLGKISFDLSLSAKLPGHGSAVVSQTLQEETFEQTFQRTHSSHAAQVLQILLSVQQQF
jgi:hypothetical protein